MRFKVFLLGALACFLCSVSNAGYYRIKLHEPKSLSAALQELKSTEAGRNLDLGRLDQIRRCNNLSLAKARRLPRGFEVMVSDEFLDNSAEEPSAEERAAAKKLGRSTLKEITNQSGKVELEEKEKEVTPETGLLVPPEVADKISNLENRVESLNYENRELKTSLASARNRLRPALQPKPESGQAELAKDALRSWWSKSRGILLWMIIGAALVLIVIAAALMLWHRFSLNREIEVSENGRTCRFAGSLHYVCQECHTRCFMEAELNEHVLKCTKAQGKKKFERTETDLNEMPG